MACCPRWAAPSAAAEGAPECLSHPPRRCGRLMRSKAQAMRCVGQATLRARLLRGETERLPRLPKERGLVGPKRRQAASHLAAESGVPAPRRAQAAPQLKGPTLMSATSAAGGGLRCGRPGRRGCPRQRDVLRGWSGTRQWFFTWFSDRFSMRLAIAARALEGGRASDEATRSASDRCIEASSRGKGAVRSRVSCTPAHLFPSSLCAATSSSSSASVHAPRLMSGRI